VVDATMDGLSWVRKQIEQADTDLLREMVKLFCERVMGEEARLLPLKRTVRHPLDPRPTFLRRTPTEPPRQTGANEAGPSEPGERLCDPAPADARLHPPPTGPAA
jgi:hypothetical protein